MVDEEEQMLLDVSLGCADLNVSEQDERMLLDSFCTEEWTGARPFSLEEPSIHSSPLQEERIHVHTSGDVNPNLSHYSTNYFPAENVRHASAASELNAVNETQQANNNDATTTEPLSDKPVTHSDVTPLSLPPHTSSSEPHHTPAVGSVNPNEPFLPGGNPLPLLNLLGSIINGACNQDRPFVPSYFPAFPAVPAFPPNHHPLHTTIYPQHQVPFFGPPFTQFTENSPPVDTPLDLTTPNQNELNRDRTDEWVRTHGSKAHIRPGLSERNCGSTSTVDDDCNSLISGYSFSSMCLSSKSERTISTNRRYNNHWRWRQLSTPHGDPVDSPSETNHTVLRERNSDNQFTSESDNNSEPRERSPTSSRVSVSRCSETTFRIPRFYTPQREGLLGPAVLPQPISDYLGLSSLTATVSSSLNSLIHNFKNDLPDVLPIQRIAQAANTTPTNTVLVVPYIIPQPTLTPIHDGSSATQHRSPETNVHEHSRSRKTEIQSCSRKDCFQIKLDSSGTKDPITTPKIVRTRSQLVRLSQLDQSSREKDAANLLDLYGHGKIVELLSDGSSLVVRFATRDEANEFVNTYDGFRIRGQQIRANLYFSGRM